MFTISKSNGVSVSASDHVERRRSPAEISYYVIAASTTLDDPQLLTRTDDLKRKLPVGAPAEWVRAMVHDCRVFNIAKWNDVFPQFPLSRDSVADTPAS